MNLSSWLYVCINKLLKQRRIIPGAFLQVLLAEVMVRSHHFVAIAVVGERVESPEVHACGHSHVGCHLVYVVLLYILHLMPYGVFSQFSTKSSTLISPSTTFSSVS